MPTMILVEDEELERNSLINYVDWSIIGIEVIGEAGNGAQGFSLVEQLSPDIVVTDINMPIMDGIELSKKIRRHFPETKIIFISSYDDFEYAKQAINLSIDGYVMKPVIEAELLQLVKSVSDEIIQKALEKRIHSELKKNYNISKKLAKQALISRTLYNLSVDDEELRSLGLEWIFKSTRGTLGIFLCEFDPNSEDVIKDIVNWNDKGMKFCINFFAFYIAPKSLISLFRTIPDAKERTESKLKALAVAFSEKENISPPKTSIQFADETINTPQLLFSELIKSNIDKTTVKVRTAEKKKNKEKIADEIEAIILSQYASPLTLDSIAEQLFFTPNYVGTVFKTVKKCSVNQFLSQVRLNKALELLEESTLSISEISQRCGFNNLTYFHSTFKNKMGVTPTEFRKEKEINKHEILKSF